MDNIIGNRLKQLRIEHQLTMEMMCEEQRRIADSLL